MEHLFSHSPGSVSEQLYQEKASASLGQAECLPFAAYSDRTIWQKEAQQIFRNDWVFACCEQELANPGDYFAFQLAGEALVIIRGKNGALKALSNVCRHRGTPLLDAGFGNVKKLVICPYHGWAYDDEGALKAAPLVGKVSLDKKQHCLPRFQLESWNGLVFINISEHPTPFQERIVGFEQYMGYFDFSEFKTVYLGNREIWNANWKLAMENAMESYHLFKVHAETLETVTPTRDAFYVAGHSEWSLTAGKMEDASNTLIKWLVGKTPEVYNHYVLVSIPPSFVGILTYDSFDWLQVLPIDEQRCEIRSGGIARSASGYKDKAQKNFTDAFFAEDKEICERVQTGMTSQLTRGGKLVEMERVVVDFHQYLSNRLFQTPTDSFYESEEANLLKADE